MQVIEGQPHGIIADRLYADNADVPTPGDQRSLSRAMTLHLGARALYAEIFRRQVEA